MPATTYTRATNVLWRNAPDRVLVRRIGHDGVDLIGLAAIIWIALDTPTTLLDLQSELSALLDDPIDVVGTLEALVADGLIVAALGAV